MCRRNTSPTPHTHTHTHTHPTPGRPSAPHKAGDWCLRWIHMEEITPPAGDIQHRHNDSSDGMSAAVTQTTCHVLSCQRVDAPNVLWSGFHCCVSLSSSLSLSFSLFLSLSLSVSLSLRMPCRLRQPLHGLTTDDGAQPVKWQFPFFIWKLGINQFTSAVWTPAPSTDNREI